MNWQIYVAGQARRQIKRLTKKDAGRIEEVIDAMTANPFLGDIEKLKDQENAWRRRIGAYRILYEVLIEKKLVYIYDVKRRTSKTY